MDVILYVWRHLHFPLTCHWPAFPFWWYKLLRKLCSILTKVVQFVWDTLWRGKTKGSFNMGQNWWIFEGVNPSPRNIWGESLLKNTISNPKIFNVNYTLLTFEAFAFNLYDRINRIRNKESESKESDRPY